VSSDSILAFWAVSLLLIAVPGADWAFTIAAGVRRRAVVPAVAGLAIGYLGITAIVAAGVGAIVARSDVALTTLSVGGGAYLVWHGVSILRQPRPALAPEPSLARTDWATLGRGVGVSGLNPKGLLILLAVLPQFTDRRDHWPVSVQIAVLGLVFTATCAVFYLALGTFSRSVLEARPRGARIVTRASGLGMVVVGALLIADRLAGW
jgi:threonine/homoserine/homoserine lactone efflux protein